MPCSIQSLVPEILCRIFFSVIPHYTTASWGRVHQDAMVCSHVCRYWRDAALSDSTLWARVTSLCIGLPDKTLFNEMWARSGDCLLSFDFSCCARGWLGYYNLEPNVSLIILWTILQHLPRIEHLNISNLLRYKYLPTLNLRDTPQLRSLTCTLAAEQWTISSGPDPGRELLLGELKLLESLTLVVMDVSWSWNLIKGNLTHLSVTLGRFEHSLREDRSWKELLDTLARSPRLQTLSLTIALPPVRSHHTEFRLNPIPMRHLRSIEINSHTDRVEALLDLLQLPDTVDYILRPTLPDGMSHAELDNEQYSMNCFRLLERFKDHLAELSIDRITRTDVYRGNRSIISPHVGGANSKASLEFWHYHPAKWAQKPVESLAILHPFSETVRLRLSGHRWHLSLAEGALCHFPRLECLEIAGHRACEYFFRVCGSSNMAAVWPALVKIRELWLSHLTPRGTTTKDRYFRGREILRLCQTISEERGHKLPLLRLPQSVIDSQRRWAQRIRESVEHMDVIT